MLAGPAVENRELHQFRQSKVMKWEYDSPRDDVETISDPDKPVSPPFHEANVSLIYVR